MFKDNKYKNWYFRIIDAAKKRDYDGYVEKHHIVPRCAGGDDSDNNLVRLTAREHFICHLLLVKMTEGPMAIKMSHAVGKFVQSNKYQDRRFTSWEYGKIRQMLSESRKGIPLSEETKRKVSKSLKGNIPYNKGQRGMVTRSAAFKENLSKLHSGKTFVERFGEERAKEVCQAITNGKLGKPSGMLGKTHSEETRKKMSQSMRKPKGPQKRIDTCPHCSAQSVTARHIRFCLTKHQQKG
jgi:hypothetical protein